MGYKTLHYLTSFLDLNKAFDCLNHEILLRKLFVYNFHPQSIALIMSYLSERYQHVKINNLKSSDSKITHGVPQGSILGPLLFLLFINDIPDSIEDADVTLYADDTTVGVSNINLFEVIEQSSAVLNRVSNWFNTNRLCLNEEKSIHMLFTLKSHDLPESYQSETKSLGLIIDNKLMWHQQGEYISKKLNKSCFFLRYLTGSISRDLIRTAYFALFHSHLNYGILIWGHSTIRHRIFSLQRKAVRIVAGLCYRDDCHRAFIEHKIFTLPCLFIYRCLEYVKTNLKQFHILGTEHVYLTRNHHIKHNNLRLSKSKNGVSYYGIKFFNVVPIHVRSLSEQQFLKIVKSYLIQKAFYTLEEFMNSKFE